MDNEKIHYVKPEFQQSFMTNTTLYGAGSGTTGSNSGNNSSSLT